MIESECFRRPRRRRPLRRGPISVEVSTNRPLTSTNRAPASTEYFSTQPIERAVSAFHFLGLGADTGCGI
eukprot:946295-Prorocentrum_minimum.AAC.2